MDGSKSNASRCTAGCRTRATRSSGGARNRSLTWRLWPWGCDTDGVDLDRRVSARSRDGTSITPRSCRVTKLRGRGRVHITGSTSDRAGGSVLGTLQLTRALKRGGSAFTEKTRVCGIIGPRDVTARAHASCPHLKRRRAVKNFYKNFYILKFQDQAGAHTRPDMHEKLKLARAQLQHIVRTHLGAKQQLKS